MFRKKRKKSDFKRGSSYKFEGQQDFIVNLKREDKPLNPDLNKKSRNFFSVFLFKFPRRFLGFSRLRQDREVNFIRNISGNKKRFRFKKVFLLPGFKILRFFRQGLQRLDRRFNSLIGCVVKVLLFPPFLILKTKTLINFVLKFKPLDLVRSSCKKTKKTCELSPKVILKFLFFPLRYFFTKIKRAIKFLFDLKLFSLFKIGVSGFSGFVKISLKGLFKLILLPLTFLFSKIRQLAEFLDKINLFRIFKLKFQQRKINKNKKGPRDKKKQIKKEHLENEEFFSQGYHNQILKPLVSFFVLILLLTIPFKVLSYYTSFDFNYIQEQVLSSSKRALSNFESAAQALTEMNTQEAGQSFSQANVDFLEARSQVEDLDNLLLELSRFAPQEEMRLASVSKEILSAGQAASDLGKNLTSAFEVLLKFKEVGDKNLDTLEVIDKFQKKIDRSLEDARKINSNINKINPDILPEEYRSKFLSLKRSIGALEGGLVELSIISEKSKIFLSAESYNRKYLVVFQNSNELRASGGFVGSLAELDFSQGELRDIYVPEGGSYDLDGGLKDLIASPQPLHLVSPRWYFRDANWWPDWPTSARNLMNFYEKSKHSTVDGCIAITPRVLERILEATGPLNLGEEYGIIDSENFWQTIREEIEEEKESDKPKKIISALTEKIKDNLSQELNLEKILTLFDGINQSLNTKDIQLYFSDQRLQDEVLKRGWGGEVKETSGDYLLVTNTNIAGQKSDKNIKQIIDHASEVKEDGSILNTVRITRIHRGQESDAEYYRARNVNWLRVYVPKGSELLRAEGFDQPEERFFKEPETELRKHELVAAKEESLNYHQPSETRVYQEFDKTVFANWSMLDPGEVEVIELSYKLPFKLKEEEEGPKSLWERVKKRFGPEKENYLTHSLLVQRQAGSSPTKFNSVVFWPDELTMTWSHPGEISENKNNWFFSQELGKDKFLATILKSK